MRIATTEVRNRRVAGTALLAIAAGALCYQLSYPTGEVAGGGVVLAPVPFKRSASESPNLATASTAPHGPSATVAAQVRAAALVASEFDLRNYPRGLNAHIDEALEGRQGPAAFALAAVLKKCERAQSRMDGLQQGMASTADLQVRKQLEMGYMELQKFDAQCQAVNGDPRQQRQSLLRIAMEAGVESSASELFGSLGLADAGIVDALVRDASNGDLSSIATLTSVIKPAAGVPAVEIDKGRYVLLLASDHPDTRGLTAPYLELARRAGFADWPLLRGLPEPLEQKFRASVAAGADVVSRGAATLSESARREARETLEKLISKEIRRGH